MTEMLQTDRPEAGSRDTIGETDLICLSHLRWDFVFQRPQHIMSRAARTQRVFFVEEPLLTEGHGEPSIKVTRHPSGVRVVTPQAPAAADRASQVAAMRGLLAELLDRYDIQHYVLWYYTPAAIEFTDGLDPIAVVYDCMDELSAFRGASPTLVSQEATLMRRADLVFAGGASLYEARQAAHPNVHLFPSSVDVAHFAQARVWQPEPPDQATIPHPRIGYFGVLDERLDLGLLDSVAAARPDWHLVLVGPVAKIDAKALPRRPNIHYLGIKPYLELPAYLAGWDVALLPFALNEATRFISPTKTPEYLSGGKPVVSTPIRDVVHPYGEQGLVRIARTPEEFERAVQESLAGNWDRAEWLRRADAFLAGGSWNSTWSRMARLLETELERRHAPRLARARIAQAHTGELLANEILTDAG